MRQLDRHGDGIPLAGGPLQHAWPRGLRLRHLCALQRRRSDGGRCHRSGLHRRTPRSRESLLDLRRQLDHDRRRDSSRLQRERGEEVRRVGLACRACRRRQRHREPEAGPAGFQTGTAEAYACDRQKRDRLRCTQEGRLARIPRGAPGAGGDQGGQGRLRLADRRTVPRAPGGARAFCPNDGGSRPKGPRIVAPDGGRSGNFERRSGRRIIRLPLRQAASGLGVGYPLFSGRRQGACQPRVERQGDPGSERCDPLVPRWLGRPGPFDDDPRARGRRLRAWFLLGP